jgi:MFS family permease
MIDYFSWRWSFFLLAPIGFGGMLLALMNMKRRQAAPQHYPGSVDYLGAALLFAVTTTLVFILDRRTHQLIGSSTKFFLLAVFIGSLAAFLVHESRAQSPFVNLELFKIRRFSFSVVSLLVVSICYALTSFLMPVLFAGCFASHADAGRHAFHGAIDLDGGTGAGERLYDRSARTAYPGDRRCRVHDCLSGSRRHVADGFPLAAANDADRRRRDHKWDI